MTFNITKTPPTKDEINAESERLEKERVKELKSERVLKIKVVGIMIAILPLSYLVFKGIFSMTGSFIGAFSLAFAVIILAIWYLVLVSSEGFWKITATTNHLESINMPEHRHLGIEWVNMMSESPEVANYQQSLAKQGRYAVIAEVEAARAWVADADNRTKIAEAFSILSVGIDHK